MRVVIRTDASLQIGTGHVMRCLTLATALKANSVEIEFICRAHDGNLIDYIQEQGFYVNTLPKETSSLIRFKGDLAHAEWLGVNQLDDAELCRPMLEENHPEWLIIDHYAIDHTWHSVLKNAYQKLMVIDDIADRQHECDLLLDQNYGSTVEKYKLLVPENCKILAGAKYALMRPEFAQLREASLYRRKQYTFTSLLITMGGGDPDNYTASVLRKLKQCSLPDELKIIVIMGVTAPHLKIVQALSEELSCKTEVKVNVSNMAEEMKNADLAIGATGATTWERCCLGLPSIQMVIAENQKLIAKMLEKDNSIQLLEDLEMLPHLIVEAQSWMPQISQKASLICDGLGAERVVYNIISFGVL